MAGLFQMPTNGEGPLTSTDTDRVTIWKLAIAFTVLTAAVAMYAAILVRGGPVRPAIALSFIYSAGGLQAWVYYHVISRANNGILIFIPALSGAASLARADLLITSERLSDAAIQMVSVTVTACVIGMVSRAYQKRAGRIAPTPGQADLTPLAPTSTRHDP
jgi:hypothetical protein